jgi:predicted amidohydrolase YtcJ
MKILFRLNLLVLYVLLSLSSFAQKADLILTNGKIFTSDTTQLYVEALAIKGNKILAVGSNAAIEKLASTYTKRIDLDGKTVVPGFNDAHDHPGWDAPIGKSYSYTQMNPAGLSKAAVLDSIARLVKTAKPNQWIHGLIGTTVFLIPP